MNWSSIWVKPTALSSVGGPHPRSWRPAQNTKADSTLSRRHCLLPDCLEVSAEADDGEIMGLRHRTMPIETVQYHPESIGTPEGMRQMRNFLEGLS